MRTMTDHARTRKGRSSTAAERIVTAGLATATCIGVVGLLGTRMVSAQEATAEPVATESTPVLLAAPASTVATSSSGMTRSDLDAYAALLAAEWSGYTLIGVGFELGCVAVVLLLLRGLRAGS